MDNTLLEAKRRCSSVSCIFTHVGSNAGKTSMMGTKMSILQACLNDPTCFPIGKRSSKTEASKSVTSDNSLVDRMLDLLQACIDDPQCFSQAKIEIPSWINKGYINHQSSSDMIFPQDSLQLADDKEAPEVYSRNVEHYDVPVGSKAANSFWRPSVMNNFIKYFKEMKMKGPQ